ncbi:MAG TPA: response regulator [Candidatus Dormibacteraeota bacterium]|jgi:two-component system chemotaxis response regulator CheY|nr:response regulator [Candidatus Dormibacteraeota bacterium]
MAKRVLLVEDNEDVALALTVRLAGAGFEVRSVDTATGGIKALDVFEPDLVLLDLLVPEGGGFSVLKALRKAPHTRRVPVIVMTGLEDRDYEAKIRNLGVNALLYKPCDPEALLAMAREMLDLVPRIDDRILVKTRRTRTRAKAEP